MSVLWRAPGRVNLIGEHTDYNDGLALPIAINRGVNARVTARDDGLLRLTSDVRPGDVVTVPVDGLTPDAVPAWSRYAVGAVWAAMGLGVPVSGCSISLTSEVPSGAGLSSSAAVECAVVPAVADLFGVRLSRESIVDAARSAENEFVGAPTGGLDQNASVHCTDGHALLLDIRSTVRRQIPFDLVSMGAALLVIDTRVRHAHAGGEYAARRRECEQAARALGIPALRDADLSNVDALAEPLRRRARHVVTEIERVRRTVDALTAGAPAKDVGALFTESHESLRDDFEVSCDALDAAVEAALAAGAYGARMTGGGFGGSAIALVPRESERVISRNIATSLSHAGFAPLEIFVVASTDGAHRIH